MKILKKFLSFPFSFGVIKLKQQEQIVIIEYITVKKITILSSSFYPF